MSLDRSEAEQFRRLFDAHFDDLWRYARRRCASRADADDITAQVFAVAWRRRGEVPDTAARLWLFGVARYVVANHRRTAERQRQLHLRLVEHHGNGHDDVAEREPDLDAAGDAPRSRRSATTTARSCSFAVGTGSL